MKRPCWKCGGAGKFYNLSMTNYEVICPVCGGAGVLDDAVYHPPVKAKACWYCRGIEDHKIVSVKTVVDEFGRELPAYDTPYNYCPNCGKAIKGGLTDADERTDTSQDARL